MATVRLGDIAQLIRSKNAGPFVLTMDVLFDRPEDYEAVKHSGALSPANVSRLYGVSAKVVTVIAYDAGRALKVTMPRPSPSGSPFDRDVYGAQQHAPLTRLEVRLGKA